MLHEKQVDIVAAFERKSERSHAPKQGKCFCIKCNKRGWSGTKPVLGATP